MLSRFLYQSIQAAVDNALKLGPRRLCTAIEVLLRDTDSLSEKEGVEMVDIGDIKEKGKELTGDVKKKKKEVEGEAIKQQKIAEGEREKRRREDEVDL